MRELLKEEPVSHLPYCIITACWLCACFMPVSSWCVRWFAEIIRLDYFLIKELWRTSCVGWLFFQFTGFLTLIYILRYEYKTLLYPRYYFRNWRRSVENPTKFIVGQIYLNWRNALLYIAAGHNYSSHETHQDSTTDLNLVPGHKTTAWICPYMPIVEEIIIYMWIRG